MSDSARCPVYCYYAGPLSLPYLTASLSICLTLPKSLGLLRLSQQCILVYCVWHSKASQFSVSDSARYLNLLCLTQQGIVAYCVWHSKASQSTVSDSARHLNILSLTQQGISVYYVWLSKASQSTMSDSARHLSLLCRTQQGILVYCVWHSKASTLLCLTLQDRHLYWAWLFKFFSTFCVWQTANVWCRFLILRRLSKARERSNWIWRET